MAESEPIIDNQYPDEARRSRQDLDEELRQKTGYSLTVTPTLRKFGGPPPDGSPRPKLSEVFIGKIPVDYFEDELIPVLERYGKLWETRILLNDKGEGRGFAFATFYEPSVAQNVIRSLSGKEVPGRPGYRFSISMSKTHSLVVIKNLPRGKTRDALMKDFEEHFEGILLVNIWGVDTEVKPPRLIASLEFGSERAAVLVLHKINSGEVKPYRQSELEAYYSIVEDDGNGHICILHVRNLATGCTEEQLSDYFQQCPGFERARIIKSFGFIHFRDHESADRALQEHYGHTFMGNQLELAWAKTKTFSPQLPRPHRYSEDGLPPNMRARLAAERRGPYPPPPRGPLLNQGPYPPQRPPYGPPGGRPPLLSAPYDRRGPPSYHGYDAKRPAPYDRPPVDPYYSEPAYKRRPDPYAEPPVAPRTVYFGGDGPAPAPEPQPQGYAQRPPQQGPGYQEPSNGSYGAPPGPAPPSPAVYGQPPAPSPSVYGGHPAPPQGYGAQPPPPQQPQQPPRPDQYYNNGSKPEPQGYGYAAPPSSQPGPSAGQYGGYPEQKPQYSAPPVQYEQKPAPASRPPESTSGVTGFGSYSGQQSHQNYGYAQGPPPGASAAQPGFQQSAPTQQQPPRPAAYAGYGQQQQQRKDYSQDFSADQNGWEG